MIHSWRIVPGGSSLNTVGIPPGSYLLRLGDTGIGLPLMIAP
jgi:hypothetical protein